MSPGHCAQSTCNNVLARQSQPVSACRHHNYVPCSRALSSASGLGQTAPAWRDFQPHPRCLHLAYMRQTVNTTCPPHQVRTNSSHQDSSPRQRHVQGGDSSRSHTRLCEHGRLGAAGVRESSLPGEPTRKIESCSSDRMLSRQRRLPPASQSQVVRGCGRRA